MAFRRCLFIAVVALALVPAFPATGDSAATPQSLQRFSIHAELARAYQVSVPALSRGEPVAIIVTLQNMNDHEQTLAPCGHYGVWTTDSSRFYVEPDSACNVENTITLAPHNSFPGALILSLRAIGWNARQANTNIKPPKAIRIGLLPASVSMCDAIVHGSHGQCGDADTSWSNPIPLSP